MMRLMLWNCRWILIVRQTEENASALASPRASHYYFSEFLLFSVFFLFSCSHSIKNNNNRAAKGPRTKAIPLVYAFRIDRNRSRGNIDIRTRSWAHFSIQSSEIRAHCCVQGVEVYERSWFRFRCYCQTVINARLNKTQYFWMHDDWLLNTYSLPRRQCAARNAAQAKCVQIGMVKFNRIRCRTIGTLCERRAGK